MATSLSLRPGPRWWVLAVLLLASGPAGAYDVVLENGESVAVDGIALVGGHCTIVEDDESSPCPPHVDHDATLLANLDGAGGNVVFFRTGGWLRFETLTLTDTSAVIGLAGGATIRVPANLIDARRTVLEGATVDLPPGAGSATTVAKAPARSRRSGITRSSSSRNRRGR